MAFNSKARSIAEVESGLILATVEIAAPEERVFQALTNPAELPKWWGQAGVYQVTAMIADFRVGGAWRSEGVGPDGMPFSVSGVYKRIEPPHHIEFTWKPEWEPGPATLVCYNIKKIEGGTRVTLRHSGYSAETAVSCEEHAQGWLRVLEWAKAYITPPT